MKKFGEGQQPFHAIIDIPEGDSQELTTVTDQVLNSLYGELFNLLQTHGINPTTTTNADLKQVARAVWSAATTGSIFIDNGTENVKNLTHIKGSNYLFKNSVSNDNGFSVRFVNKVANTGAVFINVFDVENNQNHFNLTPLVNADGTELKPYSLISGASVEAYYDVSVNKFIVVSIGNMAALSSYFNGLGDALIAVKQPFNGAYERTQHDKNADVVSVKDFGVVGDGVVNDSISLNAALNSGANIIDGCGLVCKVGSTITLKQNQTLKNITLLAGTAGMNVVHVDSFSKLMQVKIIGTGTKSIIERGIYPAKDGVSNVYIDADISNLTVAIQAQPINTLIPTRWVINGYIHDIVGTTGESEGYGVLLSPAKYCRIIADFKNIERHAVYLSAGASFNHVDVNVDGCNNIAVQLYSVATQPKTKHNTIRGNFTNIQTTGSYTNTCAVGIIANADFNDVSIRTENTKCNLAIMVEGSSGGPYPAFNKIHDCTVTGDYKTSVIMVLNAESTSIKNNNIFASWASGAAIALNTSGTADVVNAGYTDGNIIVGNGGATGHGILNAYDTNYFVGLNEIRNISGQDFIDYSTNKKRSGFLKQATGRFETAPIPANAFLDTVIQLPYAINISSRKVFLTKLYNSSSDSDYKSAFEVYALSDSNTTLKVRVFNPKSEAVKVAIAWQVLGD